MRVLLISVLERCGEGHLLGSATFQRDEGASQPSRSKAGSRDVARRLLKNDPSQSRSFPLGKLLVPRSLETFQSRFVNELWSMRGRVGSSSPRHQAGPLASSHHQLDLSVASSRHDHRPFSRAFSFANGSEVL